MLSKDNKIKVSYLFTLFYLKYKDCSIDQLQSFLLELYKRNNLSDFFEITFLELFIEIRSTDFK